MCLISTCGRALLLHAMSSIATQSHREVWGAPIRMPLRGTVPTRRHLVARSMPRAIARRILILCAMSEP